MLKFQIFFKQKLQKSVEKTKCQVNQTVRIVRPLKKIRKIIRGKKIYDKLL